MQIKWRAYVAENRTRDLDFCIEIPNFKAVFNIATPNLQPDKFEDSIKRAVSNELEYILKELYEPLYLEVLRATDSSS